MKPKTNWSDIEYDYRKGTMSGREMAAWYSVSESAIRKKAAEGNWKRENYKYEPVGAEKKVKREAAAQKLKPVERTILTPENASPEKIVGRGRNLVLRMLDELDAATSEMGALEDLISSESDGERQQALMQAVSLKQRSDVLKSLATAAKTLSETGISTGAGGKKAERQAAAEKIAEPKASKFAPPAAPRQMQ